MGVSGRRRAKAVSTLGARRRMARSLRRPSPRGLHRLARNSTGAVVVGAMFISGLVLFTGPDPSSAVSDPSAGNIDDVPSTTPSDLGDLDLTELQYGDPAEALGLVQAPKADVDGGASLAHPLQVPPGRADVQPDLSLTYDSNGGSGWVGTGWDLSVGAITVDTEYGAPRYLAAQESETYLLDGDRLFPNAIRTQLEPRAPGARSDWVRQIEDDHDLITRHGDTPSTYCWEIEDTQGNHNWYGGEPDGLGGCTRIESAILTAPATGVSGGVSGDHHWALAYVEDISGNTMRFSYDEINDVPIGLQSSTDIGVSLYLREITYTGFNLPTAPDEPAYRVRFLRDGDVTGESQRLDVNIDASAGQPVVTRDLLRGVQIHYLGPDFYSATPAAPELVKGWTLRYEDGPFDKSLLTGVGQYGSGGPGTEHAWNEFTWFDDVTDPATGEYAGFSDPQQWGNRTDTDRVNIAAESALGTSYRGGADGGAYIGFNPGIPSKIGSFGGSFSIAGGQTNEVGTLVDLDGDGLPDKVWVTSGGTVMYRPNLNRPGSTQTGDSWFGAAQTITGIDSLGRSSDLRIDLHFEAYPVVAIQVGGGFGFSFGDRYFEDVNGDGRVDFIKPGSSGGHTVFFNVLSNGIPTFVDSSLADQLVDRLEVPLDAFESDLANAEVAGVADLLVDTSPRIDTVRRWLAPHSGTVRVQGTAALTAGAAYRGDGARVSIENAENQAWVNILNAGAPSQPHDIELAVTAGEAVWFRVHVIENAADDAVTWAPTVTYLTGPGGSTLAAALDANGRSQAVYDSAADFTLFGRNGARTAFSEPGVITVNATVEVSAGLSDDVEVVVLHGRGGDAPTVNAVMTVPQLTTGSTSGSVDLTIVAPTIDVGADGLADTEDDFDEIDYLDVRVVSDSPVDPTAYSIEITTTAPGVAPPPELSQIPADADVDIPLDVAVVPNVRVFARTDHTTPYEPVTSPGQDRMRPATIQVAVDGPALDGGNPAIQSDAVVTVKTLGGGVVARQAFTVAHSLFRLQGATTLSSFTPVRDTAYYVEVSVAEPAVGAAVDLVTSTVTWAWTETDSDGNDADVAESVPNAGQLHWPDVEGMFPSGNRGWAYAGYNADHADANGDGALVESQFVFDAGADGLDEDTAVPTAADAPSAGDVKAGVATSFPRAYPYIPWPGPDSDVAVRWRASEKETLNGTADGMQSDRLGADTPIPGLTTVGRQAPQMVSVDGDFNFLVGLVASFTAAVGGGRTLTEYEDYNGDGFPDIRNGSSIEFTGPRGAKAATTGTGDNSFDTSFALGGGLNGSTISTSSDPGSNRVDDGGANNVAAGSAQTSRGMKLGLGFDISAQWTNPIGDGSALIASDDPDAPDIGSDAGLAAGTPIDRALIDVNGDGLPDRVDTFTSGEMWVNLNLGYRFSDTAIQWSTGRTTYTKNVGGSISAGFQINAYEFAGGIAYLEGVGYSLFDWMDIDGDGVPDRMDNVADGNPTTTFGSGDGMVRTGSIEYGNFPDGEVTVDAARFTEGVPLPPGQMEVSRSTSLTGGFDFSFYIPLCIVACWLVVNPGVHGGYDRMTGQVQMVDMNGDGYLDAVRSTDPEHVEVRLNTRGRTNMLRTVTNPLGGQTRLDYARTGNTIANPESVWVMSSVEVHDGRDGDGASVQRSEFTYAGNVYDPLLRELLGFSSIVETQVDGAGLVLRSYERDFLNANPFETGTLTEERTLDAGGRVVQRATFDWSFVNADPNGGDNGAYGAVVQALPAVGTSARLVLFDTALSPRLVGDTLEQIDVEGDVQRVTTRYMYNLIGDVVSVHEENEDEIDADDTFTVITYSDCAARDGSRTLGSTDSWVSVPQTVTVYANDAPTGPMLTFRDGGPDLCANATALRIAELVAEDDGNGCGPLYAITELSFDTRGSYDSVARPSNVPPATCADYPPATVPSSGLTFDGCPTLSAADDATRYCVDYVYDDHRFTAIGTVTDNHAVTAGATYDPLTGRLASRTDENGNLTTYVYDPQGRVSTITAPREQSAGVPTVSYEYGGLDATFDPGGAHTWSIAHHRDVFNAGNTIDAVSFVDGLGRVVQRKRDAEVDGVVGEARIVEGAVAFDALGRAVLEWYPVVETDADFAPSAYNPWTSEDAPATTQVPLTEPTRRTFDALDRLTRRELPDGSIETVAYDVDDLPDPSNVYGAPLAMSRVRTTDPLGKASNRWLDVGGALFLNVDNPAPANDPDGGASPLAALPDGDVFEAPRINASTGTPGDITTTYEYDRLGRLTAVIDTLGARTTHTYDLQNAVTSTVTPDAGLVQRTFSPSGQLLTVSRANGTVANYAYDRDRLMGTAYSDVTPDVAYEYGDDGSAENAAGRVTRVVDGSMDRTYGYDVDGNVVRETATKDDNPWGQGGDDPNPPTWETAWTYDSLGRLAVLTYPDGEALTHDYDFGGRPSRLESSAPQHDLYDQYGVAVPRPDVAIVYLDEIRYDQFGEATFVRTGTGVETRYDREPTRRYLAGIDSDATAATQYDGSTSTARPLQRLEYTYDAAGNIRDAVNGLYVTDTDSVITASSTPPVNNVPGSSQHAYSYDGHYRLTGGLGTYIDQRENRGFVYEADYGPNGNLLEKRQVTTTTSTTGNSNGGGPGGNGNGGRGGGKKGDGSGTDDGTTTERTCESNTGSGGGSFNQDPETTYVIAAGDLEYATDAIGTDIHQIVRSGNRTYTHDANGNMTGWVQPCANGAADISRTLEWDAENRVTRMAEGNNDTDLRYNAEGGRTLERGAGGTTWFVNELWRTVNGGHRYANIYVGEQLVASHRTSSPSSAPAPCIDTATDPCGCDSSDACRVLDVSECDLATRIFDPATSTCQPPEERTIHFLHKDLQGSLRVATDEVGKVFQYVDYLPSGRPWVAGQSNTNDTPLLFASGWTDQTYDLVNFGERWYDPREENFLSPEPLLEENPFAAVDDPSVLSAYTYAASNPLRYIDPDGRVAGDAQAGTGSRVSAERNEAGKLIVTVSGVDIGTPKITFGGRYSNNARGVALAKSFEKHNDRAERFSTILAFSTSGDVKKIRVFGITVKKTTGADNAAPVVAPGQAGAAPQPDPVVDPAINGAPPPPAAVEIGDADAPPAAADVPVADLAVAAAPPNNDGADGADAPAPAPPPPVEPMPASPAADGPDSLE